jgi:hypothetical protein
VPLFKKRATVPGHPGTAEHARNSTNELMLFMGDEKTRGQYDSLLAKVKTFRRSQQTSKLSQEEITSFEKDRETLLNNPVAARISGCAGRVALDAESIQQYVNKNARTRTHSNGGRFEWWKLRPWCGCHH